ncbi:EF-hand domain-containing protein [Pseudomonas entomophila]|uniref:EF-hand domain-containing protein n=1 Tax=Pseudomonas entomophila TaxID=312306 RepID=UPI003EB9D13B
MSQFDEAELDRIFKKFDTNADGQLSLTEFCEAMKILGGSDEVSRDIFKTIDIDNDGYIGYGEFLAYSNQ